MEVNNGTRGFDQSVCKKKDKVNAHMTAKASAVLLELWILGCKQLASTPLMFIVESKLPLGQMMMHLYLHRFSYKGQTW